MLAKTRALGSSDAAPVLRPSHELSHSQLPNAPQILAAELNLGLLTARRSQALADVRRSRAAHRLRLCSRGAPPPAPLPFPFLQGESGRNVNGWHWTEKDLTEWAKQRLGELVAGLQLTQPPLAARTTKLESMTGECARSL